jgi:hypothetical protein
MLRFGGEIGDRHLVRAKTAFHRQTVDHFRSGPSLWGSQNDHRPLGPGRLPLLARLLLYVADFLNGAIHGRSHGLVHLCRIFALDKVHRVSVPHE